MMKYDYSPDKKEANKTQGVVAAKWCLFNITYFQWSVDSAEIINNFVRIVNTRKCQRILKIPESPLPP